MTTVATTETDVALGTLAATAEQTGCPPEPVRRMCDLADFTRGMDTTAITAIAGAGSTAMDAAAQIAPLVTEAAGALDGIGGGVPSQGLCDAGDALASHTGLWQDAVNSVGSCAGAMDQLTVGCAGGDQCAGRGRVRVGVHRPGLWRRGRRRRNGGGGGDGGVRDARSAQQWTGGPGRHHRR